METTVVVAASSLLAAVLALALLREVRLRRALQKLVLYLVTRWRNTHDGKSKMAAADRADDRDDRL